MKIIKETLSNGIEIEKHLYDWLELWKQNGKQFQKNKKLYETLLQSYSPTVMIGLMSKLSKEINFKIHYFYRSIDETNIPHIFVELYDQDKEKLKQLVNLYNKHGWYISDLFDEKRNSDKDMHYLMYDKNTYISAIVFRAKFNTEIEKKIIPPYLYHISPYTYKEKILTLGLIPKAKNKMTLHEDHIYLFKMIDMRYTYLLTQELHDNRVISKYEQNSNKYVIYEIDTKCFDTSNKLFADPDLPIGYFTLNNIKPQYIKVFDIIEVEDKPKEDNEF